MNYGFVIDNRSCIGCHACSTACKSENEVPLGVHRTWVKSVETGRFPDSRRHFQVTRCNHCANPPCVRICPVTAMYQRDDGIVEFDPSVCIGCKACMQACPYDAIHIDPDMGTASKCHFCSHRVERGIEPACVVVCPEHAIIAGDMDDPKSEISRVLAREKVTVRKPEQGTSPKLFYIEGEQVSLNPAAFGEEGYLFAEKAQGADRQHFPVMEAQPEWPSVQPQGLPAQGPISIGGRVADQMVQLAYNVDHKVPWHWPVPAYLVTKGLSSGIFLLLGTVYFLGIEIASSTAVYAGGLSLAMLVATSLLLILDLEKPERFYLILTRPQWRSWLTRGAVILTAFGALLGLWWASELAAHLGWMDGAILDHVRPLAYSLGIPLSLATAVYTAFLFGQAEGRDLWQSGLLPVHLTVQSMMMGAAGILGLGAFTGLSPEVQHLAYWLFTGSLVADLFVTLIGEFGMSHASDVAARAAHEISHGRYAKMFWAGAIALGHIVPLGMLIAGGPLLCALAAACSIAGLYFYEHAYVMAPQHIPNS
jgi:Fe-S-cluster-containing dehydrogenase component/Ni/Fe-hydrogenase subunit HybB-like protein